MTGVSVSVAAIFAIVAGALWWWKVGQGSSNWGPRLTGILMLAAGTAIAGSLAGIAQSIFAWVGDTLASFAAGIGLQQIGAILTTLGANASWVVGTLLLVLWLWALLPGGWFSKQKMEWRLALGAVVIPALVLSAPAGPIHTLDQTVIGAVTTGVNAVASAAHLGSVA